MVLDTALNPVNSRNSERRSSAIVSKQPPRTFPRLVIALSATVVFV
jgi:hypothetical protein